MRVGVRVCVCVCEREREKNRAKFFLKYPKEQGLHEELDIAESKIIKWIFKK